MLKKFLNMRTILMAVVGFLFGIKYASNPDRQNKAGEWPIIGNFLKKK